MINLQQDFLVGCLGISATVEETKVLPASTADEEETEVMPATAPDDDEETAVITFKNNVLDPPDEGRTIASNTDILQKRRRGIKVRSSKC